MTSIKGTLLREIRSTCDSEDQVYINIDKDDLNIGDIIHIYWKNKMIATWVYSEIYPICVKHLSFLENPIEEVQKQIVNKRKRADTDENYDDISLQDLKEKEQLLFKQWLKVHNIVLSKS